MLEQRAMLASEPDRTPEPSPQPSPIVPGEPLVTVCGVPLEQGERVVFFARPQHTRKKVLYVILGVLLTPLVVGLALIAYGLMYERWHLRFVAITNRRVVLQRGSRGPRWLRLTEVVDVRAKRAQQPEQPIHALPPRPDTVTTASPETNDDKTDPKHWSRAESVVVTGPSGALSIDESVPPEVLGPALAHALWTDGYLDRVPTVHHPS
jgi:hypothetical protein